MSLPSLLIATSAEPGQVVDMPGDPSHETLSLIQAPGARIRVGFDDALAGAPTASVLFDVALGCDAMSKCMTGLHKHQDVVASRQGSGSVMPSFEPVLPQGTLGPSNRQGTGSKHAGRQSCDWLLSLPSHHPTAVLTDARRAELAVDPSGLGSLAMRIACFEGLALHGRYEYSSRPQLEIEDVMRMSVQLQRPSITATPETVSGLTSFYFNLFGNSSLQCTSQELEAAGPAWNGVN